MSVPTGPTAVLPTLPSDRRARHVLHLLDAARRRMAHVLTFLHLCEHAPTWPTTPTQDAAAAMELRTATVALIKYARRHRCDACNPGRMRAALRLAALLLDLWQNSKHHVQRPDVYPVTLAHRAERLFGDTAGWVTTGDHRRLLGQTD
ncbi:hypothetical protein ACIBSS_29065 [Micromonospora aurantiaca]|uniref:hypothetical protein n=1 Tax=Micromonospora aurantiaca (nom. illeg.) TaxID=47850 RepID=UPI000F3D6FA2|nr:hypothetical protein [Micromonospora aurantiaca]RNH98842.1 hypothetical protein EEZ25_24390 [Micromonospora aurantiaca]